MDTLRLDQRIAASFLRGFHRAAWALAAFHGGLLAWRWGYYAGPHRAGILMELGGAVLGFTLVALRVTRAPREPRGRLGVAWMLVLLGLGHVFAIQLLHATALKSLNFMLIAVAFGVVFPESLHFGFATLIALGAWALTLRWVPPYHMEPWLVGWATALILAIGLHLFSRHFLKDQRRLFLRDRRLLAQKTHLLGELRAAQLQVESLGRLIPICAVCKKVRNDQGYWEEVEAFILTATGTNLTHGYCPECYEAARKELSELPPRRT